MNTSLNLSLSLQNLTFNQVGSECLDSMGSYKVECLQNMLCSQMDQWLVRTGLWCAGIYLGTGWLLWLWWNHIYVNIDWERFYELYPSLMQPHDLDVYGFTFRLFYLGDLRRYERKLYWDTFIRDKAGKLVFGYACAVLYFALF